MMYFVSADDMDGCRTYFNRGFRTRTQARKFIRFQLRSGLNNVYADRDGDLKFVWSNPTIDEVDVDIRVRRHSTFDGPEESVEVTLHGQDGPELCLTGYGPMWNGEPMAYGNELYTLVRDKLGISWTKLMQRVESRRESAAEARRYE